MKVKIEIECETLSDLGTHLGVLRDQLITGMSKEGYDPNLEEMPEYIVQVMTDNNCYGTHEVTVEYD